MRSVVALSLLVSFAACGGTSSPATPGGDAAPAIDAEAHDAGVEDTGLSPDAQGEPDATAVDAGARPDAQPPRDAGPPCFTPACAAEREAAAAARLEAVRDTPGLLVAFLRAFPKGADLHNHLSGAIYAESYIQWARTGGLCVNANTLALVARSSCGNANIVAVPAEDDDSGIRELVRAWSMEEFVSTGVGSGHDHFFATFGKFGIAAGSNKPQMLAEARVRAAEDGARYIELMDPFVNAVGTLSDQLWTGSGAPTVADLPALHQAIVGSPSLATTLQRSRADTDAEEAASRTILGCDGLSPSPGCRVTVRYLPTATRTRTPEYIFGQLVGAFELGMIDPRIVGLNLVSPEDDSVALRDYAIQMQMIGWLRTHYAGLSPIKVALHAGELAAPLLPANRQNELTYHIRSALDVAQAHRIGHGVDIAHEVDPAGLMADLRARDVLVEIGLSSNIQILEIEGDAHPLADYLAAGVPVALATDDQGVSRSSLTGEHVRAVRAQRLDYRALKQMARASLHYAFAEGASLWVDGRVSPPVVVPACAGSQPGLPPSAECQAYLAANLKARLAWSLEEDWVAFEEVQRTRP